MTTSTIDTTTPYRARSLAEMDAADRMQRDRRAAHIVKPLTEALIARGRDHNQRELILGALSKLPAPDALAERVTAAEQHAARGAADRAAIRAPVVAGLAETRATLARIADEIDSADKAEKYRAQNVKLRAELTRREAVLAAWDAAAVDGPMLSEQLAALESAHAAYDRNDNAAADAVRADVDRIEARRAFLAAEADRLAAALAEQAKHITALEQDAKASLLRAGAFDETLGVESHISGARVAAANAVADLLQTLTVPEPTP